LGKVSWCVKGFFARALLLLSVVCLPPRKLSPAKRSLGRSHPPATSDLRRRRAAQSLKRRQPQTPVDTIRTVPQRSLAAGSGEETILIAPTFGDRPSVEKKDGPFHYHHDAACRPILSCREREVKHFEVEDALPSGIVKAPFSSSSVNGATPMLSQCGVQGSKSPTSSRARSPRVLPANRNRGSNMAKPGCP